MERIIEFIKERQGKDIACYNTEFLERTIEKRMGETGVGSITEYYAYLRDHKREALRLIESLTVFYSEFFREPFAYYFLEKQLLADIISRKKAGQEIRVWSVGCASGQEPYSIAMLVKDFLDYNKKDIKLRIFASDNSEEALERGRKGTYSRSEVNQVTLSCLDIYFLKRGRKYEIASEIKEKVTFLNYDVLDKDTKYPAESIFGSFDLIFCRNLLIYYNAASQKFILDKLRRSLVPGGYLVTGEAESANIVSQSNLKQLALIGSVFQAEKRYDGGELK